MKTTLPMVNNTKLNYVMRASCYLVSNIRRSSQENKAIQNLSNCLFNGLSYKEPPFCNHKYYVQTDSSTTYSNVTLQLTALGCSLA